MDIANNIWRERSLGEVVSPGQRLLNAIRNAVKELDSRALAELLQEAQQWLELTPLSKRDHDLAIRRLQDAQRFLRSNEDGAARYELRLLLDNLAGLI